MTKTSSCTSFQLSNLRNALVPLMMLLASCDTNASAKGFKVPKKSSCTSYWLPRHKKCNGTFDYTISIKWCQLVPMVSYKEKSHGAPHLNPLDFWNAMVAMMMLSTSHAADTYAMASYDTNINANGIMWCPNITWQKSNVVTHFNCLNLRSVRCHWWCCWHHLTLNPVQMASNGQFQLSWCKVYNIAIFMPLALHDTDASGITWPKSHVTSPFYHLDLTNGMVPMMMLLTSCETDTSINGITWPKKLCFILFQSSRPNEYTDAITNVIGITWYRWKCQQCQMTEMSCCIFFDHLELTNAMVLFMMPSVACDANTGVTWP